MAESIAITVFLKCSLWPRQHRAVATARITINANEQKMNGIISSFSQVWPSAGEGE